MTSRSGRGLSLDAPVGPQRTYTATISMGESARAVGLPPTANDARRTGDHAVRDRADAADRWAQVTYRRCYEQRMADSAHDYSPGADTDPRSRPD